MHFSCLTNAELLYASFAAVATEGGAAIGTPEEVVGRFGLAFRLLLGFQPPREVLVGPDQGFELDLHLGFQGG